MNDLYDHKCEVCGGTHLPDLSEDGWEDIYTQIARELLEEQRDKGYINKELYFKTAGKLIAGINKGLGGVSFGYDDSRNILSTYLQHNIYSFSAAKSLTQMLHFRDRMVDDKGNILEFAAFKKAISDDGYSFNNNYLKTEYNTAYQSAIMAHKWDTLDSEYLQYSTVGDGKVREAHKALDKLTLLKSSPVWNRIMPQNDWNCRCTVIPGISRNNTKTDAEAGQLGKEVVTNPLFDNNVGKSRVIFKEGHPYFKNASGKESQLSYEQYGLEPLSKILTAHDLTTWVEKTIEEYSNWWKDNINYNDTGIIVNDNLGNSILFSEQFKNHINEEEPRFKYGTELKNIIESPDEIWSFIDPKNNQINEFYLKFYEPKDLKKGTGVITVFVKDNEAHSLYEIKNESRLKNIRRGVLQYSSKK